jgi:hypothetical protein
MLLYILQSKKLFGYNKKNLTIDQQNETDMSQIDKLK